jgi:type IX secretion system PorP/SprF family membrane protein
VKEFCRILFLLLAAPVLAQDIHWTQFNNNPIFQNPANAGNFKEDLRLTANYRTQWRSVSIPFQTTALAADTKWKQWGIAANYFHDQVGDGKFQTNEMQLSLCRPIAINKQQQLRAAIQLGFNQRQLNSSAFYFDNQYNGYIFDPNAPTNEFFQTASMTKPMLGLGLIHQYALNKQVSIQSGLSIFNLTRPNQSFFTDNTKRDVRVNLFGQLRYQYTPELFFEPSFQLNLQGPYRALTIGSTAAYLLSSKDDITLSSALWWRTKDAFCLQFGLARGPLYTGISYDFNYSSLVPASRGRGAFELSVRYVFSKFQPPQLQYRICPDYI